LKKFFKRKEKVVMLWTNVWFGFFLKYKEFKKKLNEYNSTSKYSDNKDYNQMFKQLKILNLRHDIGFMQMALMEDIMTIIKGGTNGEKVKIKNIKEELKEREISLQELAKEKQEIDKIENKDEDRTLKQEVDDLKKRVNYLEKIINHPYTKTST